MAASLESEATNLPIDELECRICRDGDADEPLIVPCGCSGTIRYCHLKCLLQWLSHSDSERLRSRPRCGVCQQPFRLRARGPVAYLLHRLPVVLSSTFELLPDFIDHVLQRRCSHLHCMCVRLLVVLCVLQLCLWQGQLYMVVLYGSLRALLLLDSMLDECATGPHATLHTKADAFSRLPYRFRPFRPYGPTQRVSR